MSKNPNIPDRVLEFIQRTNELQNDLTELETEIIDLDIGLFGIRNRKEISNLNEQYGRLAKTATVITKSKINPDAIEELEGIEEFSDEDIAQFMNFKQGGTLEPHYNRVSNLSESIDRRLVAKKSEMNNRASMLISLMAVFISILGFLISI